MPVSRKMQVYNSTIHYKCGNCGAEVDLTPAASIGVATTIGILALGFWGWLLFANRGTHGFLTFSLYTGVGLFYFWFTLAPLIRHYQNPLLKGAGPVNVPVDPDNIHIAKRSILWIESLGYFSGVIAPLVFAGCILGAAALIGYINFTYF